MDNLKLIKLPGETLPAAQNDGAVIAVTQSGKLMYKDEQMEREIFGDYVTNEELNATLQNYDTSAQVDAKISAESSTINAKFNNYYTKAEVDTKIEDLGVIKYVTVSSGAINVTNYNYGDIVPENGIIDRIDVLSKAESTTPHKISVPISEFDSGIIDTSFLNRDVSLSANGNLIDGYVRISINLNEKIIFIPNFASSYLELNGTAITTYYREENTITRIDITYHINQTQPQQTNFI